MAEVLASRLAAATYDIRHAVASIWLDEGAPSTQVAEWAGHSVEVLKDLREVLGRGASEMQHRMEWVLGLGRRPRSGRPKTSPRTSARISRER
ncbi:hypothetical protein GCM10027456_02640 [Kineosporia babensis]